MLISDFLKYCPNCKNKLIKKTNLFYCQKCVFYFYHNPIPTNGLIIYNETKEVLLVKRKFSPKKNYWDIPGGFINLNETLENSIKREIKEELGIDVDLKKLTYLTSSKDLYNYKKIKSYTICLIFLYKINKIHKEKMIPSDDISEAKWFKEQNINWEKIAFSGIKKGLKLFFRSF